MAINCTLKIVKMVNFIFYFTIKKLKAKRKKYWEKIHVKVSMSSLEAVNNKPPI